MGPGDTFITTDPAVYDKHLWIIVSDPAQDEDEIVILNLTTAAKHHDKTCLLDVGDHPFIKRPSAVNYGKGYVVSQAILESRLLRKIIEHRQPISQAVLERIRRGAATSMFLPIGQYKILRAQGII
jgi:hypothetical protein